MKKPGIPKASFFGNDQMKAELRKAKGFEGLGVTIVDDQGLADVVFSTELAPLKNAYLKPSVSFTTGAGTKVFVSGTKAANCPDGGNSCARGNRDKRHKCKNAYISLRQALRLRR